MSFIPEFLLKKLFYRGLEDLAPDKGIFTDTPMVNSDVMEKLREGKAEWVRCDIEEFVAKGVLVNRRSKGVPQGGPGHRELVEADMVIMATGFARPSLSFLPNECFAEPYAPPNWYLQTFPPAHASISAVNCTYVSAIGSVGNWHIGIYTRILLMFLVDPLTRPREAWMRRWVDMTRVLKRGGPTGAFDFFTYLELVWWFVFCVVVNPFRWKWAVFVFLGVGGGIPEGVVRGEGRVRELRQRREVRGEVDGKGEDEVRGGKDGEKGEDMSKDQEKDGEEGEDKVKEQVKDDEKRKEMSGEEVKAAGIVKGPVEDSDKREEMSVEEVKVGGEKGDDMSKGQQLKEDAERRGESMKESGEMREGIKEDEAKRKEGMQEDEERREEPKKEEENVTGEKAEDDGLKKEEESVTRQKVKEEDMKNEEASTKKNTVKEDEKKRDKKAKGESKKKADGPTREGEKKEEKPKKKKAKKEKVRQKDEGVSF